MIINESVIYSEMYTKNYFGLNIRIFTTENSVKYYPLAPWRYEIEYNGRLIQFSGIPNYLETRRKAFKRAWFRAKWLSENSFDEKYK